MSNVELCEALKGSIPEAAARMIAEHFRPASELATKADLAGAVAATKADLATAVAELRGEIKSAMTSNMRWMLTFFIPVWAGTWGTVIAVILKG